jgi:GH18 family chitinase
MEAEEDTGEFKIIGYYSGDLFDEPLENLQTDKLTHVIYAFLIPRKDGTLIEMEKPEKLRDIAVKSHNDGTKVFIAVGGWSYGGKPLQPVFAASDEARRLLIENIIEFVDEYNLDGVELDWEHPNKNTIEDFEKLTVELSQALKLKNKELTAALNGAWSETAGPEPSMVLTEKCLESYSFINVMAYDTNNADHSPLWFSETSIDYWLNRGVAAEDIVLGMPLYARPSWMQYRHLVELNPDYAYVDYAPTAPLESYYNGMNTLREKTTLALNKAGGVMLFDVNEDTNDEYSIVSMIDNVLDTKNHLPKNEYFNRNLFFPFFEIFKKFFPEILLFY